jgi:hypothetical protein
MRMLWLLAALGLLAACDSHEHERGHDRDHDQTAEALHRATQDDAGHAQVDAAGHGHGHAGHEHEEAAISLTHFSDGTELFVEFPPLVEVLLLSFAARHGERSEGA